MSHRLTASGGEDMTEVWTCRDCGRSVAIRWPVRGGQFHAEELFRGRPGILCLPLEWDNKWTLNDADTAGRSG